MTGRTGWAALAVVLGLSAGVAPGQEMLVEAYIREAPFVPIDYPRLEAVLADEEEAGHSLAPLPMAVLAFDLAQTGPERVRYRLRMSTAWVQEVPRGPLVALNFVEVVRFNLGPAIRENLVAELGHDAVADAEAFGLGPHISYRVVTRPIPGEHAALIALAEAEIGEAEAQEALCLGQPCLIPFGIIDEIAPWGALAPQDGDGLLGKDEPVGVADIIAVLAGEVTEIERDGRDEAVPPHAIEIIVEVDLGQEEEIGAAMRWGDLLDDSVAALWERVVVSAGQEEQGGLARASAFECARGPAFAAPGAYCP